MKFLLFVYFFLSGITWVAGEAGRGITGRLAMADVFMLLLIGIVILHPRWIRASPVAKAAALMFLAFSPGLINTRNLSGSIVEWMVHAYAMVGFVVLYSLVVRMPWEERLEVAGLWVRAATLLAVFGLYEFVGSVLLGLPSMLTLVGQKPLTQAALTGTFRNTGQAGVFFGMALATAIPIYRVTTARRPRLELLACMVLLVLALMFTIKRAAMLGTAAGLVLLLLMDPSLKGRLRSAFLAVVGATVLVPGFLWMMENSPAFAGRVGYKLGERGADAVETFAYANLDVTREAFTTHPLVGAGLGGISGVWTAKYEIHSTYLGVLAMTGVVGTLAYLWFMFVFFRTCTRSRNDDPRARVIGRLYLPLLLGLMISFGYVNHLRKREFWITGALAAALMAPEAARVLAREQRQAAAPPLRPVVPAGPVPPVPVPL